MMAPAVEITMAGLGESVSEGPIANWLKSDGDVAEADDSRLKLETDQAAMETSDPHERRRSSWPSYDLTAELQRHSNRKVVPTSLTRAARVKTFEARKE